jgi:ABC-2 type transport system permease protein
MHKLLTLIKKEIREMVTLQVLIPALVMVALFMFIGNVLSKETAKAKTPQEVLVVNNDNSTTSKAMIEVLKKSNFKVTELGVEALRTTDATPEQLDKVYADAAIKQAKEKNISVAMIIPAGFGAGVDNFKPQKIETFTVMKNFNFQSSQTKAILDAAVASFNNFLSDQMITKKTGGGVPADYKNPIQREDTVIIGERQAKVSPGQVIGFVQGQATFVPIILFIIITLAATMIATAVATEKENKTLETLLTAPVDRRHIIIAKMAGASTVALIMAGVYILGFGYYLKGLGAGVGGGQLGDAAAQLGLVITPSGYALIGLTLFLGILCALSMATVIGSFAQDAKGVQGLISPLMILLMLPYLLLLLVDISTASPVLKYLIYAIPFSYTFMAIQNVFLQNYQLLAFGIGYSFLFFVVFVMIAGKIFSSDKIITLKLNFGRKKKGAN